MLDFYKEQSEVDNSDNKIRIDHPNNTTRTIARLFQQGSRQEVKNHNS